MYSQLNSLISLPVTLPMFFHVCLCFSISSGKSSLLKLQTLRGLQEWKWPWPEPLWSLQVRARWEELQHRTRNTSAPYLWECDGRGREASHHRFNILIVHPAQTLQHMNGCVCQRANSFPGLCVGSKCRQDVTSWAQSALCPFNLQSLEECVALWFKMSNFSLCVEHKYLYLCKGTVNKLTLAYHSLYNVKCI